MSRALSREERDLLAALLRHDFAGVEQLREQLAEAAVFSSCGCGCGSLGFAFREEFDAPRSAAASPLPIEADIIGPGGEVVGGLLVLLRDGVLNDVDVFSFVDDPLPFPHLSEIRWRVRGDGSHP